MTSNKTTTLTEQFSEEIKKLKKLKESRKYFKLLLSRKRIYVKVQLERLNLVIY